MGYANGTSEKWEFDNRKRISRIRVGPTSGAPETALVDLAYTLNGTGDILGINNNEYSYDGFDRIVGSKTLIHLLPGTRGTDPRKLIGESFGAYQGLDPLQFEGETRTYLASADLNGDGRINGQDYIMASFKSEQNLYDVESFVYDKSGNRTKLVQNGVEYGCEYGVRDQLIKIYRKPAAQATRGYCSRSTYMTRTETRSSERCTPAQRC